MEYNKNQTDREITNIEKLHDVSVVDTLFYDTTTVYARNIEKLKQMLQQNKNIILRKKNCYCYMEIKRRGYIWNWKNCYNRQNKEKIEALENIKMQII